MPRPLALTDLSLAGLQELAKEHRQPAFAGRNLARWLYQRRVQNLDAMTDLPRAFRERLAQGAVVRQVEVVERREDGCGTTAFVLQLRDGKTIETVLIPEEDRHTVCVSSQVGCPVACVFCASGLNGLMRNLTAGEIVEQVLVAQDALPENARVTNVVVMGIGEPTMNLDALLQATETWNSPQGLGLGARRITISTVGYPARIRRLADQGRAIGLAISLHAPRQDLRAQLLPGAAKVPLADLLDSARYYTRQTGRQVTFEYTLLKGLNDSPREADELVRLLAGFPGAVNLIPVNPVDSLPYERPSPTAVDHFRRRLVRGGVRVTRRRTRGDGIAAACGQLRLRHEEDRASAATTSPETG